MKIGYIKLHRKAVDSALWEDANAWRVFEWLLLNCNWETGVVTAGRKQISKDTGIKEGTIYHVLQRLVFTFKNITLESNNKFSTITLLNWSKYQTEENRRTSSRHENDTTHVQQQNSNTSKNTQNSYENNTERTPERTPQRTTNEQQKNTIKEVKNIRNKEYLYIGGKTLSEEEEYQRIQTLQVYYPDLDVYEKWERFKAWQVENKKTFAEPLLYFETVWLKADQRKLDHNVITSDPIFTRLKDVWTEHIGTAWMVKNSLQEKLENKYEGGKYKNEWKEAMEILHTLS